MSQDIVDTLTLGGFHKVTDRQVQVAGRLYETGRSLNSVAQQFNVNEIAICNKFTLAGIQVRARSQWDRR